MKSATDRITATVAAVGLWLAPVAATSSAQDLYAAARPSSVPVSARSIFDASLRCMDDTLSRTQSDARLPLYLSPLEDARGNSQISTRDLAVAAMSRMSERSRYFTVYPHSSQEDLEKGGSRRLVLMGSITGMDDATRNQGGGGGLSIGGLAVGSNKRRVESVLTVSLYLLDAQGAMVPGTVQSLSMALKTDTKAGDLTASIGSSGGIMQFDVAQQDGVMAAVRGLIDLAAIQLVAAHAGVPSDRCLALVSYDQSQLKVFRKLKPPQAILAISQALVARGFYPGPAQDHMSPELQTAIARYEAQHGDPPLGQPSFTVWSNLTNERRPAAVPRLSAGGATTSAPPAIRIAPRGPRLKYVDYGRYALGRGERADLAISVASPAHVTCFHTDAHRRTTRIYPTVRSPARRLAAGDILLLPGPDDVFTLEATELATESVTCLASAEPLRFPPPMDVNFDPSVTYAPLPQGTPAEIVTAMEAAGNRVSADTLTFTGCDTEQWTACPKLEQ